MITRILMFLAPLAVVLALGAPAQAGEKMKLEHTPAKVQETIKKHVQNGTIKEIEREQEKGKAAVFEVEYKTADGKEFELKISEDGKLISKEED